MVGYCVYLPTPMECEGHLVAELVTNLSFTFHNKLFIHHLSHHAASVLLCHQVAPPNGRQQARLGWRHQQTPPLTWCSFWTVSVARPWPVCGPYVPPHLWTCLAQSCCMQRQTQQMAIVNLWWYIMVNCYCLFSFSSSRVPTIKFRVPTIHSWQISQPFLCLFQNKIAIFPTNFTHIFVISTKHFHQIYHQKCFCNLTTEFQTTMVNKFPNFSKLGNSKIKFLIEKKIEKKSHPRKFWGFS